jgi:3-hydroxyisobutyrate dehydrogenase
MAHKDAELVFPAGECGGVLADVAGASARKLARAAEHGHAEDDMAAAYFGSFSG